MKLPPMFKVGAKGKMTFVTTKIQNGITETLPPRVRSYRIDEIRSNDFIVVRLDESGNDMIARNGFSGRSFPARMYCDLPKNKRDGSETVEWTPTGYIRTLRDIRPNISYIETVTHEIYP